jgi:pimeloyl-ACP methyl ester carboxylesterase
MFDNRHLYKSSVAYHHANAHYAREIERITVPYQLCYVPTRYGTTHVLMTGATDKPTVALWHGLNVNLTMWVHQINLLAPHYRVIAIDTIGNMGRSEGIRPDKHSNALGWWASDVLDGLGVERVFCAGISQGGFLVIKLATVAPQKIAGAILFSCAGIARIQWDLLARMIPPMIFPNGDPVRANLKAMTAPTFEPAESDLANFGVMMNLRVEHRIPLLRPAEVRALTAPTWLLMGAHDKTFSAQRVVNRAKTLLPNLHRADIFGHVSHGWEEDKPLLNRLLQEFLATYTKEQDT